MKENDSIGRILTRYLNFFFVEDLFKVEYFVWRGFLNNTVFSLLCGKEHKSRRTPRKDQIIAVTAETGRSKGVEREGERGKHLICDDKDASSPVTL